MLNWKRYWFGNLVCIIFMLAILGGLVLYASIAHTQTWVSANQVTVAWDAVTTLSDGTPIPETDTVQYNIYLASETDVDKTDPILVGTTTETQYTITMEAEGRFFVGAQTERLDSNGNLLNQSSIGWSDNSTYVATETFGVQFFLAPAAPTGLGVQ